MDKKSVHCPICGSENVRRNERENNSLLTLGGPFSYIEIFYSCNSCNEESDYFGETDKNYLIAEKKSQAELVKKIIDNLHHSGISMAAIERVFELPFRTLTRWKTGDISASGMALLRIITTYSWIIDVADQRFDKNAACFILLNAAIKEFERQSNQLTHLKKDFTGSAGSINRYNSAETTIPALISIEARGF